MIPGGAWAACVTPDMVGNPVFRHFFDSEAKLWGCENTTALCKVEFPVGACWFIGSVSETVSLRPCPACLKILNRRKGGRGMKYQFLTVATPRGEWDELAFRRALMRSSAPPVRLAASRQRQQFSATLPEGVDMDRVRECVHAVGLEIVEEGEAVS